MEIDVTRYFETVEHCLVSGSRAELGQDAAKLTWACAMAEAETLPFVRTPAQLDAVRGYFKSFGAWDEAEIAAWSPQQINAMVAQEISNAAREGGLDGAEPDWDAYQEGVEAGRYGGVLYKGDNGKVYIDLSN